MPFYDHRLGNAFVGPAFVDLESIATRERALHGVYARRWERATGRQRDEWLDDVGWAWAKIQIRAQYLAFPLTRDDVGACLQMTAEGDRALDALGVALARRRRG